MWRREGIELNAGASKAELDDLRATLGRQLPDDVREFYTLVNGMPDLIYDAHFVSFWSIEKIRQELGKWSNPEIGFADFLIHSWRFILRSDDAADSRLRTIAALNFYSLSISPKADRSRGSFAAFNRVESEQVRPPGPLPTPSLAAGRALRRLSGPMPAGSGHDVIDDRTLGIGVVLNERPFLLSQS